MSINRWQGRSWIRHGFRTCRQRSHRRPDRDDAAVRLPERAKRFRCNQYGCNFLRHTWQRIGITKAKRYQCVYQNPISKEADMSIQRSLIACAAVFAASTSACYAGPCSQDIARLQAAMDARVGAAAAAGPRAPEGTAATMHRQPTPRSMATAESELGG